jgi:integrase/recombinase XerD
MEILRKHSSQAVLSRFIPLEVLAQLITHLDSLPAHSKRMVMLLLLSGISVNKLCPLPFDCLVRDPHGVWFLCFDTSKMPIKYTIPLSPIALAIIQEQQQALKQDQHGVMNLLFLNANGQAISPKTFMAQLNRLAVNKNICDASGQVWRFRSHQFRYTLGAQMVNGGVPFQLITQHLGHQVASTALRYVRI